MRSRSLLVLPALLGALLVAAAPAGPAPDQAGSSEAETVPRSCGAEADDRYDPPSGAGLAECKDAEGNHDDSREYTATHWTNDVSCGTDDELPAGVHDATGVSVSGNFAPDGTNGAGYLQTCSDGDLPIQGRFTLEGGAGSDGGAGTFTADGDRDNEPEQLQGWAQVDLGEQSVVCGKSYEEGGRADAANQTEGDGSQENCG